MVERNRSQHTVKRKIQRGLQKEFTVNYLTKKLKKNEGELPQYYVREDHEAIISAWLFDYVQEHMKEREYEDSQRYSGVTTLSSKLVCGKCGGKFTLRPWHAKDKYRTIMWQCRNRWRKPMPCKTHNVADKALHFVVHDTARTLAVRKKLTDVLVDVLAGILPDDRIKEAGKWMAELESRDISGILSDEEDLVLTISQITVRPDKTLQFYFIGGRTLKMRIPKYSRKDNEVFYDKR